MNYKVDRAEPQRTLQDGWRFISRANGKGTSMYCAVREQLMRM